MRYDGGMNETVRFSAETRPRKVRFTIEQFYRMEGAGAFEGLKKTELLDGEISSVNAQHMPHMRAKVALFRALDHVVRNLGGPLEVGIEGSIELGQYNLPEPDIFIWEPVDAEKGAPDGSVRLVIEVADSSEVRDLNKKRRIYARHGVREYWVAVLRTRRIERFSEVVDGHYRRHDSFAFSERVESVTLPGVAIAAGTLTG